MLCYSQINFHVESLFCICSTLKSSKVDGILYTHMLLTVQEGFIQILAVGWQLTLGLAYLAEN